MKGLVVRSGQLQLVDDLPVPTPGPGQVRVEVLCASVNPTDLEMADGTYDELLRSHGRLELPRTGLEFSGIVRSTGQSFEEGAEVFGYVDLLQGEKTHQAQLVIEEAFVARKPALVSFEEAAALPLGGQTSLVGLRDVALAREGERVLINGASGGLGVFAVQIAAKRLQLHVTAVAGPGQDSFLHGLGAHEVLDYTKTDVRKSGLEFDVIFDLSTKMRFDDVEHLLSPKGRFMPSEPLKAGVDFTPGARSGERSANLWIPHGDGEVAQQLAQSVVDGSLDVIVDSVHAFEDFRIAFDRMTQSSKRGRIVVRIAEGE
ncbi:MAG: NAD(P)-dependent alcohol dehydrogenase [Myxococcota bacterium]